MNMERRNAWKSYNEGDLSALERFSREYCAFLNAGKTERECVAACVRAAGERGYIDLNRAIADGMKLESGAKLYVNWMNKAFMLFVLGRQPLESGMNILGAVSYTHLFRNKKRYNDTRTGGRVHV